MDAYINIYVVRVCRLPGFANSKDTADPKV